MIAAAPSAPVVSTRVGIGKRKKRACGVREMFQVATVTRVRVGPMPGSTNQRRLHNDWLASNAREEVRGKVHGKVGPEGAMRP